MTYSRRDFLSHLSLGIGIAAFGGALPNPSLALPATGQRYIVGTKTTVCSINLQSKKINHLETGFRAHSFARNPRYTPHMVMLEKWGPKAAIIEYKEGKDEGTLVHVMNCPQDHLFFGHAAFSPFDNRYLLTRVDMKTGLGYIIGYDAENFKEVSNHQVSPGGLHEVHFSADNKLLIASNGMRYTSKEVSMYDHRYRIARPALIHYDLEKDTAVDNTYTSDDEAIVHFNFLDNGAIIGISTNHTEKDHGNVYYLEAGGSIFNKIDWGVQTDRTAHGEVLNIAIDPGTRTAMINLPDAEMIVLIDWKTGKFIKRMDHQKVRGLTYNPVTKNFICARDTVKFLDPNGHMEGMPIHVPEQTPLIGSHGLLLDV